MQIGIPYFATTSEQ